MRPTENDPAHHEPEPVSPGIPDGLERPEQLLAIVYALADAPISSRDWASIKRALIAAWPRAAAAADYDQLDET